MAELNVINNIPHTTYTVSGDDFEGFYITIKPTDGYKIVTSPAPTYTVYEWGNPVTKEFDNVTETEVSNIFGFIPDPMDKPVTLDGQTTNGEQPTFEVINNVTGDETTESHSYAEGVLSITITATDSRRKLFDVVASYTDTSGEPRQADFISTDNKATVSISDADSANPITVTGVCGIGFTITNNLVNCTVDGLKDVYSPQETITINLTANDGYVFSKTENTPKLYAADTFVGEKTQDFEFEDNATTATLVYDLSTLTEAGFEQAFLQGGAIAGETPVVGGNYGAINVYVVTTDELNEFAQGRFYEQQDTGEYVNRIKRIFANVPTAGDTTISCGNTHTTVHALTPAKQILTLDFGTVTIPAHNGNTTDYDAEIRLFVPFHGFVDVPADYAGKDITLVCLVDIITGKGVAKLTCDGIMFNAYDIEPSQDVIYRTVSQQVNVVGGDTWDNGILYGTEPYVHCKWYASQPAGRGAAQNVSKIGALTGFNVLTDITPIHTGEMLSDEQETIYRLLQTGVYIE